MQLLTVLHGLAPVALAAKEGGRDDPLGVIGLALAILALLALLVVLKAAFIAAAVWFRLRYPAISERMYGEYQLRPWLCTGMGLLNLVAGFFLGALLISTQILALLGLALWAALIAGAVLAYGAAYRDLGRRLAPDKEDAGTPGQLLHGGLLVEGLFFVPVFGQLLSLGVLLKGLGAVALAFLVRYHGNNAAENEEAEEEPEAEAAPKPRPRRTRK